MTHRLSSPRPAPRRLPSSCPLYPCRLPVSCRANPYPTTRTAPSPHDLPALFKPGPTSHPPTRFVSTCHLVSVPHRLPNIEPIRPISTCHSPSGQVRLAISSPPISTVQPWSSRIDYPSHFTPHQFDCPSHPISHRPFTPPPPVSDFPSPAGPAHIRPATSIPPEPIRLPLSSPSASYRLPAPGPINPFRLIRSPLVCPHRLLDPPCQPDPAHIRRPISFSSRSDHPFPPGPHRSDCPTPLIPQPTSLCSSPQARPTTTVPLIPISDYPPLPESSPFDYPSPLQSFRHSTPVRVTPTTQFRPCRSDHPVSVHPVSDCPTRSNSLQLASTIRPSPDPLRSDQPRRFHSIPTDRLHSTHSLSTMRMVNDNDISV
jgi:hypothetical protein